MKTRELSRLSVGITYRYDYKKMLFSQGGTFLALVFSIITEGHPPFGDNPYELISFTSFLVVVNLIVLVVTIITVSDSEIRLFPTMLVYTTRKDTYRIDFARVMHLKHGKNSNLIFTKLNNNAKEEKWVEIKNYNGYKDSDQLIGFLQYLLKDKYVSKSVGLNVEKEGKKVDLGPKNRKSLLQRLIK
ncbi:MAG: hypothetical protein GF404_01105 [candidate division Zixibacteria bacterium]|nr:hypothetical protein [candidate division Zixibacteria bacterium]